MQMIIYCLGECTTCIEELKRLVQNKVKDNRSIEIHIHTISFPLQRNNKKEPTKP